MRQTTRGRGRVPFIRRNFPLNRYELAAALIALFIAATRLYPAAEFLFLSFSHLDCLCLISSPFPSHRFLRFSCVLLSPFRVYRDPVYTMYIALLRYRARPSRTILLGKLFERRFIRRLH